MVFLGPASPDPHAAGVTTCCVVAGGALTPLPEDGKPQVRFCGISSLPTVGVEGAARGAEAFFASACLVSAS
jgi:hypothetical protein